ncbi:hypothetical protein BJX70DRAFT_379520 [Aspergillus crustosus]
MSSSLSKSRWAPSPNENLKPTPPSQSQSPSPSPSPSQRAAHLLSPSAELSRFMKIVARLKWKLPFLAEGYRLATLPLDEQIIDIDIAHAEIMFKLDFHEYYALLERALVHLLGVFGATVAATPKSQYTGTITHRYHANVLDALEAKTSPLRAVLGSGSRKMQLRRAKELRNRWKTADQSAEEKERDEIRIRSAARGQGQVEPAISLREYDLEKILMEIFDGLEDAYHLAEAYVAEHDTLRNGRDGANDSNDSSMDWDFIVDAMDWEAV